MGVRFKAQAKLKLTIVGDSTVAAGHDATDSTPPPSNTSSGTLKVAPALGVGTNHDAPPLADGAEVLDEGVGELGELGRGGLRNVLDKAETVSLNDRSVVNRVVEEELDLRTLVNTAHTQATYVLATLGGLEVLGLAPVPLAEASEDPKCVSSSSGVDRATHLKAYRPASLITQSPSPLVTVLPQISRTWPTGATKTSSRVCMT